MLSRNRVACVVGLAVVWLGGCTPTADVDPPSANTSADATGQAVYTSDFDARRALATSGYWEAVPEQGVELGMGWDSREGRVVPNRCVKISPVHSPGQTTTMTLDEVTSRSDVTSALKVSASASVKTMVASGSASASFAKSTRVSSQSTTLLLNASIINGVLFAGPADASAEARSAYPESGGGATLHKANNDSGRLTFYPWVNALLNKPEKFRAYCGDGFVSALNSGARLLASFEITGSNKTTRQATAATIKAKYGAAKITADTKTQRENDEGYENTSVRYLQVGGARGAIATTPDALTKKLEVLAKEAFYSPRLQDMRITPYSQMAEVRFASGWRDNDDEYDLIADTYWQLTSFGEDIQFIIDHYDDYKAGAGLDEVGLKTLADSVLGLRRAIFAAMDDPTGYFAETTAEAPVAKLFPKRSVADVENAFKFRGASGIDLAAVRGSRNIGELAERLRRSFPLGNPTLLLLNLPVPDESAGRNGVATNEDVVDYYIRPIARRACDRSPIERDCLSNTQLEQLEKLVPTWTLKAPQSDPNSPAS